MNSKKHFAISMVATLIAFVIQFGVNFAVTPYIVSSLGAEAYGFVPLINNLISYSSFVTMAVNSMAGRFIGVAYNRGDIRKANEYFSSVLIADAVIALILAVPFAFIALFPDVVMNIPTSLVEDVRRAFVFSALSTEFSLVLSVYGTVYYIKNRLDKNAVRNIEGNVLRAGTLLALFVVLPPQIAFVPASMLVLNLYNCVANIYYTKKYIPEFRIRFKNFKIKKIKELLSSGIWNTVNNIGYTLLITLDLYLANRFLGARIGGEYSLSKTMPTFITNITFAVAAVFGPQLLQYYSEKQNAKLVEFVHFSLKFMGMFSALPIGFLIVFGVDFFNIWVPGQNSMFLQHMSIITLIALLPSCCTTVLGNLMIVLNKVKVPALAFLSCGILNIICVIPLLMYTNLGIWSIILIAAVLDFAKNLFFVPWYASRSLGISPTAMIVEAFRGCLCIMPMLAVSYIMHTFFFAANWIQFVVLAFTCASIAGLCEIFVVFNKKERKQIYAMFKKLMSRSCCGGEK